MECPGAATCTGCWFKYRLLHCLSSSLLVAWEKQQQMARVFGFLHPQETQKKLMAPGFILAQPQLVQPFGE